MASSGSVLERRVRAFRPGSNGTRGIDVPLLVVNVMSFARGEAVAFRNPRLESLLDGLGMGLGFTGAITLLAAIRELIGAGTLFGAQVMPLSYQPMAIVTMTPGGFIVLGFLLAFINWLTRLHERKKKEAQA